MTEGYSGTPLAKKLGIKEGMAVRAVNAPADYLSLVVPLPDGVTVVDDLSEQPLHLAELPPGHDQEFRAERPGPAGLPDIVHLFTNSRDELFSELARLRNAIRQDGSIWVSWYKRAAKLPTEITEDTVREAALPLGLVDVKVCAVDEKWSGLKLVIRRENRV